MKIYFFLLAAPLLLQCEASSKKKDPGTAFTLSWDAADESVTEYGIFFGTREDASDMEKLMTFSTATGGYDPKNPSTNVTVSSGQMRASKRACFQLKAVNAAGESPASAVTCIDLN